jgi:hypothetical protein
MSHLEGRSSKAEGETIMRINTFKDYKPGFIHIDIKYSPQVPDETSLSDRGRRPGRAASFHVHLWRHDR